LKYLHIPSRAVAPELVKELGVRKPLPVFVNADSDEEMNSEDYVEEVDYYVEEYRHHDDEEEDEEDDDDCDGSEDEDSGVGEV
jgi:hypothetical protein